MHRVQRKMYNYKIIFQKIKYESNKDDIELEKLQFLYNYFPRKMHI